MNIGIRTLILILIGAIGTAAIVYGKIYSIPDSIEVRYGLPLTWGTNILSTISGPVNIWSVDPLRLTVDVAFWFTVLIVASALVNFRRGRQKETQPQQAEKTN